MSPPDDPQRETGSPLPRTPSSVPPEAKVVFDVVAGPNLRWRDNLFQAVAILISIPIGVGLGWFLMPSDAGMAMVLGGFGGLLVGLFGSGIFLMVWRAIAHLRGRHD